MSERLVFVYKSHSKQGRYLYLKEKDVFLIASMNLIILIISTAYLVGASYNPFLYFRF